MARACMFVALLACLCVAGCSPYQGLIYTDVKTPGAAQMVGGFYPAMSSTGVYELDDGKGPGSKQGEAAVHNILGLVAVGDASVEGAAADGGIGSIHTIDQEIFSFLGIYSMYTTRVTGE